MINRIRIHRSNDTKIIRDVGYIRKDIANPSPRLSILLEAVKRAHQRELILACRHAS